MFERNDGEESRRQARAEARERADRLYAGDWLGGRLLAHGKAPFRFEEGNDPSYYVRLQTTHGKQVLWGNDLERAIRESKSHAKVGDAVGVRIVRRETLENGRTWNRWQVDQAIHIVKERRVAREILEHPVGARRAGKDGATVTGSYLLVTAAEMLAAVQFTDEASRKSFVAKVREAAGFPEPFKELRPVQGRVRDEQQRSPTAPAAAPVREALTRE